MKYFSIAELTYSNVARDEGIDNTPSIQHVKALTSLVENVLDPIRARWGAPIIVNSGYRSPELNSHKRIKGSPTSQHMTGQAADITTGRVSTNQVLFNLIRTMQVEGDIEFDQLIDEKNYSWIHVSFKETGNRNEIKHLK